MKARQTENLYNTSFVEMRMRVKGIKKDKKRQKKGEEEERLKRDHKMRYPRRKIGNKKIKNV